MRARWSGCCAAQLRRKALDEILSAVTTYDLAGVMIDFEQLPESLHRSCSPSCGSCARGCGRQGACSPRRSRGRRHLAAEQYAASTTASS